MFLKHAIPKSDLLHNKTDRQNTYKSKQILMNTFEISGGKHIVYLHKAFCYSCIDKLEDFIPSAY